MTVPSWLRVSLGVVLIASIFPSVTIADDSAPNYAFSVVKPVPDAVAREKVAAWLTAEKWTDDDALDRVWPLSAPAKLGFLPAVALTRPEAMHLSSHPDRSGEIPALLQDETLDPFVRSNLAAVYAKASVLRKSYEESLAAAKLVAPDQLSDPASYFFYRSIAEYALMLRTPAAASLSRLLDDVTEVPDRYRVVATLMFLDVQAWPNDEKDLANIGRLMDNSGRRLELARAGTVTQDIQKKIVFRLDEKIKELEAKAKGQGQGASGQCPSGAPGEGQQAQAGSKPSGPQQDSFGGKGGGDGEVDIKKLRNYEAVWGKLPEAERTKIAQEFVRDMPAKYKPMIDDYFRSLNRLNGFKN